MFWFRLKYLSLEKNYLNENINETFKEKINKTISWYETD